MCMYAKFTLYYQQHSAKSFHKQGTAIDLICTNVCTCIYEYNITYAVTLVTLFAPTCFDHT